MNRLKHYWVPGLALGGLLVIYAWIQISRPGVPRLDAWVYGQVASGAFVGDRGFLMALSESTNTIPLMVATVIIAIGLWLSSYRRHAAVFAASMILSSFLVQLIKTTVARPRPEEGSMLLTSYAWPSGHTAGALTFALALWFAFRWSRSSRVIVGLVLIPLAVLVGYSRVFASLHWATDVLAGWIVAGLAVSLAVWFVPELEWTERRPLLALGTGGLGCLVLVSNGMF